jgi:hypothetical protein
MVINMIIQNHQKFYKLRLFSANFRSVSDHFLNKNFLSLKKTDGIYLKK